MANPAAYRRIGEEVREQLHFKGAEFLRIRLPYAGPQRPTGPMGVVALLRAQSGFRARQGNRELAGISALGRADTAHNRPQRVLPHPGAGERKVLVSDSRFTYQCVGSPSAEIRATQRKFPPSHPVTIA